MVPSVPAAGRFGLDWSHSPIFKAKVALSAIKGSFSYRSNLNQLSETFTGRPRLSRLRYQAMLVRQDNVCSGTILTDRTSEVVSSGTMRLGARLGHRSN